MLERGYNYNSKYKISDSSYSGRHESQVEGLHDP